MESVHPSTAPGAVWDARCAQRHVLVLGASGARGRELVQALLGAGHPAARLALFARRPRTLTWRGQRLAIQPFSAELPRAELAFLCTPSEVSRELGPKLAARGMRVVDLSGGLRGERNAALALDEINGAELGAFHDQLALPLASNALIAPALVALEREVGLAEVDIFLVVSAATGGARAMAALRAEFVGHARQGAAPARDPATRVGCLRAADALYPRLTEQLAEELLVLLGRTDLLLDLHVLAGDLERVDCFAVKTRLHAPLDPEAAAELFARVPALELCAQAEGPVPARCVGGTRLSVGRIRAGSRGPRSLCFSAAGDQLRAGSSYAALRVASRLAAAG